MDQITSGTVLHLGTYNGNPLVMAAAQATLEPRSAAPRPPTPRSPATSACSAACAAVIADARPARPHRAVRRQGLRHLVAASGSATTATTRRTDFDLAFAQWMHGINRGILLPPGLDEQWLVSVMHDEDDGDALRRRVRRVRRRAHVVAAVRLRNRWVPT